MSNRALLIFRTSAIGYPGGYIFRAAINSAVDGDTVWVERDTGCRHADLIEIRVTGDQWKGFNAFERNTPGGKLVTAEVKRLIPDWSVVRIETKPDTEKYGRWLSPILIRETEVASNVPRDSRPHWVLKDALLYLDLAAWLVYRFPDAAHWQTY